MRAIVKRKIDLETAVKMSNEIIITMMKIYNSNFFKSDQFDCFKRKPISKEGVILVYKDEHKTDIFMVFDDEDMFKIITNDHGRNYHSLKINIQNGEVTVAHFGEENSTPDTLLKFLPESFSEINNSKNWEIAYISPESDPVFEIGLIKGHSGKDTKRPNIIMLIRVRL